MDPDVLETNQTMGDGHPSREGYTARYQVQNSPYFETALANLSYIES